MADHAETITERRGWTREALRWGGACVAVLWSFSAAAAAWETDYEAARETAKSENRFVLLNFSGSDWCGWCMRLEREVFSRRDFNEFAEERLVCVVVDFPRRSDQPRDLRMRNQALKREYNVGGFPTVILLDPHGRHIATTGYRPGGAEEYVEHLKELIEPHEGRFPARSPDKRDEAGGLRTWTSRSGATVEGTLVERSGGWVSLRKADGRLVRIRERDLSDDDQAFLHR